MESKKTKIDTLKFIQLYRSHPILWDMNVAYYKHNKSKTETYIKIANEMNITVEMVKRKIRGLRTSFGSEKRKIEIAKTTGPGENKQQYSPTYKWFHELSFLDSVYCIKTTEASPNEHELDRKRRHEEVGSSDNSSDSNESIETSCQKKPKDKEPVVVADNESIETSYQKKLKDKEAVVVADVEDHLADPYPQVRRYMVQIPKSLLPIKTADVQELNQRYISLGIPADFFLANIKWSDIFTPDKPFSIRHPCNFHIIRDMPESLTKNSLLLEPADANYLYSAKVMLLALPPIYEIYKKCFDNRADKIHYGIHPWRLINFLIGVVDGVETMAIGGPWSSSLDGENPDKDPAVLIRTAIRTCKALTGIDLSKCTQWYRFVEIYYHRQDGQEEDDYLETVVIYLPDVYSLMPNIEEWQRLLQNYNNTNHCVENKTDNSTINNETENKSSDGSIHVDDTLEDRIGGKSSNQKQAQKLAQVTQLVTAKKDQHDLPNSPHIIVRPCRRAKDGKFDCVLKSMSVLLDHHPDNFKENSFEISLFVELFNDMLMRDFGFNIYKEISLLKDTQPTFNNVAEVTVEQSNVHSEMEEEEFITINDEKENYKIIKDNKSKGSQEHKIPVKQKDVHSKIEKEEEFIAIDDEKEDFNITDYSKSEENQPHNDTQAIELHTTMHLDIDKTIIKPQLLLSFIYFDTSHCGYLFGRDLENLFYILGLNLTRSEISETLQKLGICESTKPLHYRKLTHMTESTLKPEIEVVNIPKFEPAIETEK